MFSFSLLKVGMDLIAMWQGLLKGTGTCRAKGSLSHAGQDLAGHPLAEAGLQPVHLDVGVLVLCRRTAGYS